MKTAGPPRAGHPDVVYWACPFGDGDIRVAGHAFAPLLTALGLEVEPADLDNMLPTALLEEAEALVEMHELRHGVGLSTGAAA